MGPDERRKGLKIVAPLEHGNDPPTAHLQRELPQPLPPGPEAIAGDVHASQRISLPGIETRRQEQGVRPEVFQRGEDAVANRLLVGGVVGTGGKGDIEGGSLSSGAPRLGGGSRSGVKGILVDAGVEHVGPILEEMLRSIPVVDIEVEDGDPMTAVQANHPLGGDCNVVEEAEAHREVALGVMSRRANGRECHSSFPNNLIRRSNRRSHGTAGGIPRRPTQWIVRRIKESILASSGPLEPGDIRGIVNGFDRAAMSV